MPSPLVVLLFALAWKCSDAQNDVPLIESSNEVQSKDVFLSNKIICTAIFTGKQPQAIRRGTRKRPIRRLRGKLSRAPQSWCYRGADSKQLGDIQYLVWQKNIP